MRDNRYLGEYSDFRGGFVFDNFRGSKTMHRRYFFFVTLFFEGETTVRRNLHFSS